MDVMEHVLGYEGTVAHLRGQIFKYMFRLGKKDSGESEAVKISWYSSRLLDVIQRNSKELFPVKITQAADPYAGINFSKKTRNPAL